MVYRRLCKLNRENILASAKSQRKLQGKVGGGQNKVILGVDPGFGITGYGLIEVSPKNMFHPKLMEAGVIRSEGKKPLAQRLQEIHRQLCAIIREFSPTMISMEESFSLKAFPRSGISIGQVQGIVFLAAAQHSLPVFQYYPLQVKKALLGNGKASKTQVQKMVQTLFNLGKLPRPDDVADALAVALCCAQRVRG